MMDIQLITDYGLCTPSVHNQLGVTCIGIGSLQKNNTVSIISCTMIYPHNSVLVQVTYWRFVYYTQQICNWLKKKVVC